MPIEPSVFDDLQLTFFIERAISDAILRPCSAENIEERQKLFMLLDDETFKFKLKFAKLYDIVDEISSLDALLKSARCDAERDVIFASLFSSTVNFAKEASALTQSESKMLSRFSTFFANEIKEKALIDIATEAEKLVSSIERFRYSRFTANGLSLKLSRAEDEAKNNDYFSRIAECAKKLGLEPIYEEKLPSHQLSTDIINGYLTLYPDEFNKFSDFYKKYSDLYCSEITSYKTELGFYLTMLKLFDRIRELNIPLVYPKIADTHVIKIKNAYDISLIAKNETNIIPNDIDFNDAEPFYYLTGANGGGKTTYLRTVGIAVLLYINGCPLPCESAVIGNISGIFTHFPHDERFTGTGRFVEEQNRVKQILSSIDENSLVLLNETYSSTNEENAVAYTEELASSLYKKKIFSLYITHQHTVNAKDMPHLNVMIDKDDQNRRTFKVTRKKDSGGSFALDILKKYSLTKEALEERFSHFETASK